LIICRFAAEEYKSLSEKAAIAKQEADLVALKLQDARTELSTAQRDRDGQYLYFPILSFIKLVSDRLSIQNVGMLSQ
jgi:hypothetical protein